jgi:hypothetical protein
MSRPTVSKVRRTLCVGFAAAACWVVAVPSALALTPTNGAVVRVDQAALVGHLKSLGYQRRGGIARDQTETADSHVRSLHHFSSSFTIKGVDFSYTMLGRPPKSGEPTALRSVIVPLHMHFVGFGKNRDVNVDFDPQVAVTNIVTSPIYQDAQFANGVGQFGDMMQRATFWNKMDAAREWHVRMASPRVMDPVDIEVTPQTGALAQVGTAYIGNVLIDFLDSQARTIIQLTGIDADEVPIFVTGNVTSDALGYHNAFTVAGDDGAVTLQTLIYTSWLDPALVGPQLADVSTFNHEIGEWLNDPFVNNVVPVWMFPPPNDPNAVCSGNNLLEVGDPQGNGPTFADFPTVVIPLHGYAYHLQDLVMLPWFAGEKPSSAENGWYDFPRTNQNHAPAVFCH